MFVESCLVHADGTICICFLTTDRNGGNSIFFVKLAASLQEKTQIISVSPCLCSPLGLMAILNPIVWILLYLNLDWSEVKDCKFRATLKYILKKLNIQSRKIFLSLRKLFLFLVKQW